MSASPAARIRFLRDCYEADNRESAIWDLSADTVRHLHVLLMGGRFLCGAIDRIPIDRDGALATQSELAAKRAEKQLVLGAFMLAGSLPPPRSRARRRRLLAPLLVLPATIEDADPHVFVRADPAQARLNTRVVAALEDAEADIALDELAEHLPALPLGTERVQELAWALRDVFPRLHVSALERYPDTLNREALLSAAGRPGPVRLLPAVAMALAPVSPETRHVLAELTTLARREPLSPPLAGVLEGCDGGPPGEDHVSLAAPVTLSAAQRKVVHSTATSPLTLIIGPPGTGKSYTVVVAALDHALRGEAVLIVARTGQAVDVLEAKLVELAGVEVGIRGGRGDHPRRMLQAIDRLLEGRGPTSDTVSLGDVRLLRRQVAAVGRRVDRLARQLEGREGLELAWGASDAASGKPGLGGLIARHRRGFMGWRLGRRPAYSQRMKDYLDGLETQHASG